MNNAIRNFNLDVIDYYSDTCFQVTDQGRYGHLWMFWENKKGAERTSGVGTIFSAKSFVRWRSRKRVKTMKREHGTEFRQLLGTEHTLENRMSGVFVT